YSMLSAVSGWPGYARKTQRSPRRRLARRRLSPTQIRLQRRLQMRWLRLLPSILLMTLLLGGCATNPFKPQKPEVVVHVACPAIQNYSQATLNQALAEFNALPQGSAIRSMVGDYQNLRDQARACRRKQGAKK